MPDKLIPATPAGAFQYAKAMAETLNLSLPVFCEKAKVAHSAVYRWQTNQRTYDTSIFLKLRNFFDRSLSARKSAETRKKK